jgi:hypothetical protein
MSAAFYLTVGLGALMVLSVAGFVAVQVLRLFYQADRTSGKSSEGEYHQ